VVAQVGFSIPEQWLPTMAGFVKADLEVSAAAAGAAVSTYYLGKVVGSYAAGVAADWFGEVRVICVGAGVTAVLLVTAAPSPLPVLLTVTALAGVASAGATPAGGRLVMSAFGPERRGLVLGIRQTAIPLGGLVGVVVLPWVADAHGWRWSLVVAALATAAAAVPLALAGRGLVSERSSLPVERVRGSIPRDVRLLTIWSCISVTGQIAVLTYLPLDANRRTGLTLPQAALLLAFAQGAGVVGRIGWGAISDRNIHRGRKPLLLFLTATNVVGVGLLALIPGRTPVAIWALVAVITGSTLIGFQGVWITMLTEAAAKSHVGAATGFAATFSIFAAACAPTVYGVVADVTGSYRAVWIVVAAVLTVAFVPAALLENRRVVA
jgi:MFS family permease